MSPLIAFRVSKEVLKILKITAKEENTTVTEIILRALRLYLPNAF